MSASRALVLLAGGSGSRMGLSMPKAFLPLGISEKEIEGFRLSVSESSKAFQPLADHLNRLKSSSRSFVLEKSLSLAKDSGLFAKIVCVLPSQWVTPFSDFIDSPMIETIEGGDTRQESVSLALNHLEQSKIDQLLIHDAARCFVTQECFESVVFKLNDLSSSALKQPIGVTLAIPAVDTCIELEGADLARYLDRSKIASVQTPQGFFFDQIKKAHDLALQRKALAYTDDLSLLMDQLGAQGRALPGDPANKKVTFVEDLH